MFPRFRKFISYFVTTYIKNTFQIYIQRQDNRNNIPPCELVLKKF